MQARSKRVKRLVRVLHLRVFTNRSEEEDHDSTDSRVTACGLPGTPHHLESGEAAKDCHVNMFQSEAMGSLELMAHNNPGLSLCATCKKRVELMGSLGGFA